MNNNFVNAYKKVKNLGASHHGSSHFLWQRLSAILLIPFLIWILLTLLTGMQKVFATKSFELLASQNNFHTIPLIIFLCIGIYHGMLGIQVIIEDYIRCKITKNFLIISCKLFSIATIIIFLLIIIIKL